jgi:predicted nucleotidyltransferase
LACKREGSIQPAESIQKKFTEALDDLVAQVKKDRSVLAAILCGSLSHDTVWAKSDIDLALVTIDDKKVEKSSLSLYAGGVNVHAFLMPRAEFRKTVEGAVRNSFMHSLLAKGRLLYTHDETIAALCARLHEIGERDTQLQLLAAATQALTMIDKAHKWFVTRGDLDYTALWILYAATPLARIEVMGARLLADREVIPQAMKLNPAFFQTIYTECSTRRRRGRTCRRRWTRSTATWRSARPRCSSRCWSTCARWAKRARPPRSRPTSSATSTWKG